MKDGGTGQVRSLTRALTILRQLAGRPEGLSLTELSDAAALPPSTTHRLLTTLEAERFVRPDPQTGLWRIGVAAFFVGSAFVRSRDKLALARPYLRRLMEMSGETANLFVQSEGEAVCIGQIESRHAMRATTGVGGRIGLHASAAGKALLAHLGEGSRRKVIGATNLPRLTDATLIDAERLQRSLEDVLRSGYAVDDEEHAVGLRCIAAPVFDEFGQTVAAISVSGPKARIPDERIAVLGEMVTRAAAEVTREYGGDTQYAAQ